MGGAIRGNGKGGGKNYELPPFTPLAQGCSRLINSRLFNLCRLNRELVDPRAIGAWIKKYEADLTTNYINDPIIYRSSNILSWCRLLCALPLTLDGSL